MRAFLLKYGIVFAVVFVSGVILMDVSQRVQSVEREIARNERIIAAEHESIRVLHAEWAYLNDPARLEAMAAGGLNLSAPDVSGLVSDLETLPKSFVFVPPSKPAYSPSQVKSPLYVEISNSSDKQEGQ